MNAPHASLPAAVVADTTAEIEQLEELLASTGPREKLAAAVSSAQAAVKAREAAIVAAHGVPLHVDGLGNVHRHPGMREVRRVLDAARSAIRAFDETQRKLDGLRRFLETGSKLDRPFRAFSAPSETGRVVGEGRGKRLEFNQETREFRIVRTGTDPVRVPEVDGPSGVAKRRAASRARGN